MAFTKAWIMILGLGQKPLILLGIPCYSPLLPSAEGVLEGWKRASSKERVLVLLLSSLFDFRKSTYISLTGLIRCNLFSVAYHFSPPPPPISTKKSRAAPNHQYFCNNDFSGTSSFIFPSGLSVTGLLSTGLGGVELFTISTLGSFFRSCISFRAAY